MGYPYVYWHLVSHRSSYNLFGLILKDEIMGGRILKSFKLMKSFSVLFLNVNKKIKKKKLILKD